MHSKYYSILSSNLLIWKTISWSLNISRCVSALSHKPRSLWSNTSFELSSTLPCKRYSWVGATPPFKAWCSDWFISGWIVYVSEIKPEQKTEMTQFFIIIIIFMAIALCNMWKFKLWPNQDLNQRSYTLQLCFFVTQSSHQQFFTLNLIWLHMEI